MGTPSVIKMYFAKGIAEMTHSKTCYFIYTITPAGILAVVEHFKTNPTIQAVSIRRLGIAVQFVQIFIIQLTIAMRIRNPCAYGSVFHHCNFTGHFIIG